MPPLQHMSLAEMHSAIESLRQHRINTLPSLRHVERRLAALNTPEVSAPMTAAWTHYVSSNQLLTELRGLTKTYAFSAACVAEARRRVYADPGSNCSWNLAWLVLRKIADELVEYYAQQQASRCEIWGAMAPEEEQVKQLEDAMVREWKGALDMLLRYWEVPPTR